MVKKLFKKTKERTKQFAKDRLLEREARAEANLAEARETLPRITNDTVAEHREEVLSSARKYIYPLQHSKHKIVLFTVTLFVVTIIAFFSYCTFALYKSQSSSTFIYGVTRVVPFPIARIGKRFVAYENYLFELRRYQHYYETQQNLDFNSESGKQQLLEAKNQALKKVVDDAYIKEIAKEKKISVSDQEVSDQITILRQQNRLGSSDKVFEDVLRDFWGWSVADYRRSLRQQLLAQKVLASLDTETATRANSALAELKLGGDFAAVVKQYSDDASTKQTGGDLGLIDRSNRDVAPQMIETLFKLEVGQFSEVINTGYSLEIVKVLEKKDDKVRGAHILFNLKDINTYLNERKDQQKTRSYVRLK